MSLRRALSNGFFTLARPPSAASLQKLRRISGEDRGLNRFLHRRPFFQSSIPLDRLSLPVGDQMMERIHGSMKSDHAPSLKTPAQGSIIMEKARKVLRMEAARTRLRKIHSNTVSYSEFVTICGEVSSDHGRGIAKALDESGSVIVLGDVVFLRPDLIAGAVESMISSSKLYQNDPRRMELKEMRRIKAEIDCNAEALVRKELWGGLGLLALQTAGFMRLTFWELSWDVMEPVCFFVTSIYFMAGYAFFLRTSRDPSFEGFFESRYLARQKQLMEAQKFDINKFNELQREYKFPPPSTHCDFPRRSTLLGVAQ